MWRMIKRDRICGKQRIRNDFTSAITLGRKLETRLNQNRVRLDTARLDRIQPLRNTIPNPRLHLAATFVRNPRLDLASAN
jgi:hypothetical protein